MNYVPQPQEEKLGYCFQSGACLGVFETMFYYVFFGHFSVNGLQLMLPYYH